MQLNVILRTFSFFRGGFIFLQGIQYILSRANKIRIMYKILCKDNNLILESSYDDVVAAVEYFFLPMGSKHCNTDGKWPGQLGLQNTPTASLQRGKTSLTSVLDMMLNNLMVRSTPLLPSFPSPLWVRKN